MTDEEFAQWVTESFLTHGRNGVEEAIGNYFLHDWRDVDDRYVTLIINLIKQGEKVSLTPEQVAGMISDIQRRLARLYLLDRKPGT